MSGDDDARDFDVPLDHNLLYLVTKVGHGRHGVAPHLLFGLKVLSREPSRCLDHDVTMQQIIEALLSPGERGRPSIRRGWLVLVRTVGQKRVTLGVVDGRADLAGVSDPLEVWSLFPVAEVPRPLVLVGSAVRESGGFDSGAAKIAYLDGAIDTPEDLPPGLYKVMCPRLRPSSSGLRLRVVAVRSVVAPYLTDRGARDLPAWEVTLTHFDGVVTILDPATLAQAWHPEGWSSTTQPGPGVTGGLHEDGRTVTLDFTGTPRAYADYPTAEVRESSTAVVMVPVAVDHPGLTGARLAYAERRQVAGILAEPLGARVLLTGSGFPVPVTQSA